MGTYVKSMSQRKEGDDREKMLPVDVLAQAMIAHGEEFESDSLFGNCLISGCFRAIVYCVLSLFLYSDGPGKREDSKSTGFLCCGSERDLAGVNGAIPNTNEGVPGTFRSPFPEKTLALTSI